MDLSAREVHSFLPPPLAPIAWPPHPHFGASCAPWLSNYIAPQSDAIGAPAALANDVRESRTPAKPEWGRAGAGPYAGRAGDRNGKVHALCLYHRIFLIFHRSALLLPQCAYAMHSSAEPTCLRLAVDFRGDGAAFCALWEPSAEKQSPDQQMRNLEGLQGAEPTLIAGRGWETGSPQQRVRMQPIPSIPSTPSAVWRMPSTLNDGSITRRFLAVCVGLKANVAISIEKTVSCSYYSKICLLTISISISSPRRFPRSLLATPSIGCKRSRPRSTTGRGKVQANAEVREWFSGVGDGRGALTCGCTSRRLLFLSLFAQCICARYITFSLHIIGLRVRVPAWAAPCPRVNFELKNKIFAATGSIPAPC